MRKYINAVPAYGRDYTSKAKLMADWESGKDFHAVGLMGAGYFNKDSFVNETEDISIEMRYAKQMKVCIIHPVTKTNPNPKN